MTKTAKERLIRDIAHKLGSLREYTLHEVAFFVDYIEEREQRDIQLSPKELEELKKIKLEMNQGEYHTLEEL